MHRGLATHFRPDDINIADLMGDVSYTSKVTRRAAVLLAPSINFPLSEQPTDQMVLDAVDRHGHQAVTAWDRCERGGEL